jgi:hypothetical protein
MLHLARLAIASLCVAAIPCQQPAGHAGADVIGADAAAWAPHRATKVLYAGWPGGSREAAFRAFLERHFDRASVIDLAKLSPATAAGFDVVIADWGSQYGNDGYQKGEGSPLSAPVKLDDTFDVPVIAMDYVSTNLRPRRKLDWL